MTARPGIRSRPEHEVDFTVQAVENLVTQFSGALDFYRELVQNSIDAGSAAIEVWMEYEAGAEDDGTIAIHVDDFGEGMNEAIIDDQLTRLFSSSKDGDLTKIGKFGIGFVSIFAPDPRAVLLHTGRGGEVCFDGLRKTADHARFVRDERAAAAGRGGGHGGRAGQRVRRDGRQPARARGRCDRGGAARRAAPCDARPAVLAASAGRRRGRGPRAQVDGAAPAS